MTTEQLAALKEVAENAIDANLNAPNWFEYQAAIENFRAEWTPVKCKALLEEVERLTDKVTDLRKTLAAQRSSADPGWVY
jgi:hypothetical protein